MRQLSQFFELVLLGGARFDRRQSNRIKLNLELDLPRFHGHLEALSLCDIFHQIGDGGFAFV